MLENKFQANVIRELKNRFKGCIISKNDSSNTPQGFPDLTIIYKNLWATLEVKASESAHRQVNQEHYISKLNSMGFSKFIYPENMEEVLDELAVYFSKARKPRR